MRVCGIVKDEWIYVLTSDFFRNLLSKLYGFTKPYLTILGVNIVHIQIAFACLLIPYEIIGSTYWKLQEQD